MDVICIGEAVIDMVSRERGKTLVTASEFTAATGGAPANVAAGLARLGRESCMVATVGDDVFGRKIQHDLEVVGVLCKLRIDPDHFTTLAFVKQGAGGERDFEFAPGAHDYLLPEQIEDADIRGARVLHYGSISLRTPQSREATLKAIRIAKDAGVICSCDPNWRPDLWQTEDQGRAAMLEAIAHADVLKISDADLHFIAPGIDDHDEALAAIGFTGRLAAVTLGAQGSWYRVGDVTGSVPSPAVQVAETTGAGDAFLAALLDSLLAHNMDLDAINAAELDTIIQRACAAGALTATGFGAIPSLPDAASINAMLRMMRVGNGAS